MMNEPSLRCTLCAEPPFLLLKYFVKHLKTVHLKEDGTGGSVRCPYSCLNRDGSEKFLSQPAALSQHLSKVHPTWRDERKYLPPLLSARNIGQPASSGVVQDIGQTASSEVGQQDIGQPAPSQHSTLQAVEEISQPAASEVQGQFHLVYDVRRIAQFYLALEAECLVPTISVQKVCDEVANLSDVSHEKIAKTLHSELSGVLPEKDINSLILKIRSNDPVYSSHHKVMPGPNLTSDHLRKAFYQKNYQYQVATEYRVGNDPTDKESKIAYVHMRKTITLMLDDPTVQKQVDASFEKVGSPFTTRFPGTIVKSYKDGSAYRKKVATDQTKTLDVIFFQDGFNPTSSSSRLHDRYKTVGMYFTLGNLSARNRSKLSSLRLVMLVFEHILKNNRQECFQFVVDEFTELYKNGVMYKGECIRVELKIVSGDNAGQHMLGGFIECFGPLVKFACRYCEITNTEYHQSPWIIKDLRTPEMYKNCVEELNEHVKSLISEGKLRSDKTYHVKGIKRESELNKIPGFKMCDPPLAPCIGHDGFGGAWEYDMAKFINFFVMEREWFSYDLLNARISDFKFLGSDASNVPSHVNTSGEKLGGNEIQNWTLIRLFPFLIGDKVKNLNDVVWQLYLKLRIIIEMVCAPKLTLQQICDLKALNVQYLKERCSYKIPIDMKVTIKTHITAHFADLYEILGPLFAVATFRFESKHAVLSRIIDLAKTHVNVLATMSSKDQLHMSYLTTQEIYSRKTKLLGSSPLVVHHYQPEIQKVLKKRIFTTKAVDVQTAHLHGQVYHRDDWLLLTKVNSTHQIGKISCIISDGEGDSSDIFFVLKVHPTAPLESYGVYEILEERLSYQILMYSEQWDIVGQAVYNFNNRLCFSLKYFFG